jgi:hypothetical protein
MKPTGGGAIRIGDAGEWSVSFHRTVRDTISEHGTRNRDFAPTFGQLIASLRRDPKQYPKKAGPLQNARAARLRFRGREAWRAVFVVDEQTRPVSVLALGPHDRAYEEAVRRIP